MKMKFIVIGVFLFSLFAQAQTSQVDKTFLLLIDSLKNALPLLHDSAKAQCLNELAYRYANSNNKFYRDSSLTYINQAYKESIGLNYTRGIARSLFNRGIMEMSNQHFIASERYFRECIPFYEKIRWNPGMSWSHFNLGYTLYAQGNFDNAIPEIQTSIALFQEGYLKYGGVGLNKCLEFLSKIYELKGETEKGFELAQKSLAESQQRNDSFGMAFPLMIIGDLYKSMEDYSTALEYYHLSAALGGDADIHLYLQMAAVHNEMHHYDSALYFHRKAQIRDPDSKYVCIVLGEIYLQQKKYNEALLIFKKESLFLKKNNFRKELLRLLPDIAKAYTALKDYPAALYYAQEGLTLAQTTGSRQYKANSLKMLATIYDTMGVSKKSIFYLKQYIALKDSLLSDQFKAKIFTFRTKVENEKKQAQIELLKKEKQINQQKLQKEALMKKILIGSLAALVLLGIIIYRNIALKRKNEKHRRELAENELQIQKLESEKTKAELQQQATDLEMQALRAQMNPHFIFNCLSSINRFILKNETEAASDYLTKFSRLIRTVLTNSKKPFITLADELEMLRLYLDMERLRFKNSFEYKISFKNELDAENIFVPPLLLQPFAENAIWHGLMHKQGEGHLEIALSTEKKILTCIISDDGIGRNKAAMIKSRSAEKQKSMGLEITSERLALLNQDMDEKTFFNIEDIIDDEGNVAGTRVILKMLYKDMTEAFV